jgi:hypothetical protein
VTWIIGCMKFAFKTGASSASEAFITKIGRIGISHSHPNPGRLEVPDLEAIEAIAV